MVSFSLKKGVLGIIFLVILVTIAKITYDFFQPVITPPAAIVTEVKKDFTPKIDILGFSAEGRPIESFTFGKGTSSIVFVGGVHGGYEWNSVLLAYTFIDYLEAHPEDIPKNVSVVIIPVLNPDGLYLVTGKTGRFQVSDVTTDKTILSNARFNSHEVDLNRNFDCKWRPKSTWQSKIVSAGTAPFSEPEAKALQGFIRANTPEAVVFWHSQSNGVYASMCEDGILPEALTLMNTYSLASGYKAYKIFGAYETTGAADDWLASINIPAITVELETHETIEWERNLAGGRAVIGKYGK